MENETVKNLWALRKVNEGPVEGLKTTIFVLEKEEQLSKERKQSIVESLKGLISQSEEIYGEAPTKH